MRHAIEENPVGDFICRASLFGSYATCTQRADSDVDVLVELEHSEPVGLFKFVELQRYLADYVGKPVDLSTPDSLSKYFRDEVLQNAQLVYEK